MTGRLPIEDRRYQDDVIHEIKKLLASGVRRVLLQAETGSGKTIIAVKIIYSAVALGEPVVILVHTDELIGQMSLKLLSFGIAFGVIKNGHPMHLHRPVQLASIQTLHSRAFRSKKIPLPEADWLFIDEAHRSRARTWMQVIESYPNAYVIGLSATPCRLDGKGLGNIFEELVCCPDADELQNLKFLAPARVWAPSRPDLRGIKVRAGDYVECELEKRVNTGKLVGDIVSHWFRLAEGSPTICFATSVAHSMHIVEEFKKAGVAAAHIDGATPREERKQILRDLANGKIKVISNCAVLTEGWDSPLASCAILARPTKSLGLYRQMIGRVRRPAPGKIHAIVLDHSGGCFVHGLPNDKIIWALARDEKTVNRTHEARGKDPHTPRLTTCPRCSAVREEGRPCPQCGWRPQRQPKPVDIADGELAEIGRDRRPQPAKLTVVEQRAFYQQLMGVARQREYKPQWAAHKYKEKFGVFPPWGWNNLAPLPPGGEVSAWVRSRNIAYAWRTGR
jgi:superfamily II DNA or RNA helicase